MANLTRYDPFVDLFDDLMKGFLVRPITAERANGAQRVRVDVSEQPEAFKVVAELPGVKKEEIQVTIDGDLVSISAETRKEKDIKEGERVVHSERYYGKVSRAFRLGQDVDQTAAQAKYADGVLELVLPKKATAAARKLTIQ
jgi:HSP20 family protein